MIVNITKGSDPYGLCRYLLGKELGGKKPNSHYLGGNMSGQDATELAEEFRFSHDLNRRVEKNMIHYSVSLPPGERVDNETMVKISEDLLFLMGHCDASSYERLVKDKKRPEDVYRDEEALTQFFIVQHLDRIEDTDCQHWHVAASRVRLDGTLTRDSFERYRVREAER